MINTVVKKSRFLSVSMVLKAGKEFRHTTKKQVKTLIIKSKKAVIKDFFKTGKKSDTILTLEEKASEKTGFKLIKQSGKNDSVNPIIRIYLIKAFNRIK
ncbi:hypothetical protein [Photorhabdus luminescens]|uniref:Uncharacterized protein n=1 Tax=Photorhabdus luminescens subsp. sonorensis TaxID=1173677 RepID=A0A5C4RE92_PHOLU|nr:hypothetical protein [Photorhabdus luminescens]TNH42215.1 hypothetical protein EP164_18370 [Photorhabdus luminescens subsp. sonorensis]